VQAEPALEPHAQALFLRACRLGVASGCTNAAADIDLRRERAAGTAEACTVPTYERTCAAGDAWGCTMLGDALLVGRGVRADPSRARVALEKACHGDEADPACVAARRLLTRSGAGIDGPP
jgi:TPR repeat protein